MVELDQQYIAYCDTPKHGEIIFMGNDLNYLCDLIDTWYASLTDSWCKCDLKEDHILSGNYKFLIYEKTKTIKEETRH